VADVSSDIEQLEALTETGHHVTGATGHEEHGALTDRHYVIVALSLAVITGLEVSLTYIDIGPLFLPLLIVLMLIKFFTVVLFFMHLRFDNKLYSALFYMGLGLAVFVYVVAMFTFHVFDI
jgi:cytochrome c oxidase subunit 4